MKFNLFFLCIYIIGFSFSSFSQQNELLGWGSGEIYIGTRGLEASKVVSYKMEAVSPLWARGNEAHQFVLNPINPSYKSAKASRGLDSLFGNTVFSTYNYPFFRMNLKDGPLLINSFAYGLYKFYIEQYSAYFFIDYRDAN